MLRRRDTLVGGLPATNESARQRRTRVHSQRRCLAVRALETGAEHEAQRVAQKPNSVLAPGINVEL